MEHQTTPPAERSLEFLTDKLRESNRELAEVKQSLRHLETTLDCIEHWNQEIAKALGVGDLDCIEHWNQEIAKALGALETRS